MYQNSSKTFTPELCLEEVLVYTSLYPSVLLNWRHSGSKLETFYPYYGYLGYVKTFSLLLHLFLSSFHELLELFAVKGRNKVPVCVLSFHL